MRVRVNLAYVFSRANTVYVTGRRSLRRGRSSLEHEPTVRATQRPPEVANSLSYVRVTPTRRMSRPSSMSFCVINRQPRSPMSRVVRLEDPPLRASVDRVLDGGEVAAHVHLSPKVPQAGSRRICSISDSLKTRVQT